MWSAVVGEWMHVVILHLELRNGLIQLLRQIDHSLNRLRCLMSPRARFQCYAGDGLHRAGYVPSDARLLFGRCRDFFNQLRALLDDSRYIFKRLSRFFGEGAAALHLDHALFHRGQGRFGLLLDALDQASYVTSRSRAPFRKLPDLFGDDAEADACFSRVSGFYSRVQGEEIGLRRYLVDEIDDLFDLAASIREPSHLLGGSNYREINSVHRLRRIPYASLAAFSHIERPARGFGSAFRVA